MRPPKISRAFGVLLLSGWFAASGASAASLQVAPVLLEVVAPGAAATVTLRNNGAKPIATQVRVFRWIQDAGKERLEPTEDVVASPPAIELQPAQDYVVRVVRVTKSPVEGEEAYRLFIDELPEAQRGPRTVNFVVRYAIPLFFDALGSSAPEATWRVTQNGRAISLGAANGGDRRLRLASVRIGDAAGKSISFGPGLVGYALGRSAMTWTAPASKPLFRPGAKVTISGQTEEVRSMCKPWCNPRGDIWRTGIIAMIVLGAATAPGPAGAEGPLQLEVQLNGQPTGLIGAFLQDANGELSAKREELEELHLKVPDRYGLEDEVALAALPGVSCRYDEARQTVDIAVAEAGRLPRLYDLRWPGKPLADTQSSTGAVLNYLFFGGGGSNSVITNWQFQGASATLDARLFSSYGIVSQTGILASNTGDGVISQRLRLDSTWTYKDPERILTYRAGDTISGGLAWTRPVRLGGLQVQRDFATRPDLVTLPLPSFSGSAAVPSTVDVYVNNVRTISQDVDGGPFRLNNLPILSGQGNASIIVRDSSGRDVETTLPFLVSNKLLRGGLLDFSVESGFPRLFYGALSNVYAGAPAGSGSVRYGFSDHLTLEAHAEATTGLANGGVGASLGIDRAGVFSAAFAGSGHGGTSGGQVYAGFDTELFGLSLSASTLRTIGGYDDLASVTARPFGFAPVAGFPQLAFAPGWFLQNPLLFLRPPKIQDQFSIGLPLPLLGGSINFGYVRQEDPFGNRVKLLDVSYSRQLFDRASFFATAFAGLADRRNAGISIGLSIPLGGDVTASSGVSRDRSGLTVASDVTKPLREEPGSYGWRLSDHEGEQHLRLGSAAYRGDYGKVEATAIQSRSGFAGTISQEGAIVVAGGDVFFANRIDDAFAIVDAGAPGIEVFHENRPVAHTDGSGKAIVPSLNAYQPNKISIDPRDLPLDASIATTQEVLAPPDRSGVLADFGIRTDVRSAIVILNGANGQPLQAGLRGKTAGGRGFFVGYDGRAFIEGLEANNIAIVELASGECRAEFAYAPQNNAQVSIGPVVCR